MKRRTLRAACAIGLAVAANFAQAKLVQYTISDTNGGTRSLQPSPLQVYMNPVGTMEFALSAGIDRKLRFTVSDAAGTVLTTETTEVLGPANRILVAEKSYYGAIIKVKAPPDGKYTVVSEILTSTGSLISRDENSLVVDTKKPSLNGQPNIISFGDTIAADGLRVTGGQAIYKVTFNGIKDDTALEKAYFKWVGMEDAVRDFESAMVPATTFNKESGEATLGTGIAYSALSAFPKKNGKFRLVLVVEDSAGNRNEAGFTYYNVALAGAVPEFVGIYDAESSADLMGVPALKGFVAAAAGVVVVKDNPTRVLFKTKKTNYRNLPEGEIYGGYTTIPAAALHTDAEYVYFALHSVISENGALIPNRWSYVGLPNGAQLMVPSPRFSPQAVAPGFVNVEPYVDGYGYVEGYGYGIIESFMALANKGELPRNTKISKLRFTAAARAYDMIATRRGVQCEIPAGATSCEASISLEFGRDLSNGAYHESAMVYKKSNSVLRAAESYAPWPWHFINPVVAEMDSKPGAKIVTAKVLVTPLVVAGNDIATLKSARAEFVNPSTGSTVYLQSATMRKIDERSYEVGFNYGSLPDGRVNIKVSATDNWGNVGERSFDQLIEVDNAGPIITITQPEKGVTSLDEIMVSLADALDPKPTVVSVNISGGPANDSTYIAVRSAGENAYGLEYPVMFPSLKPGEEYKIAVVAQDAAGNRTTETKQFVYQPVQVSLSGDSEGNVQLPAIRHAFKRAGGGSTIETEPLKLRDGAIVSGTYPVSATLRSDAQVALVVNGVTVNPGETKVVIAAHNFAASGGRISLPVMPAQDGVEGKSSLLVTTAAPNSPILVANVATWRAQVALAKGGLQVVQGLQPVSVKVGSLGASRCRLTGVEAEAQGADVVKDPVCLVQWTKLPVGVEAAPAAGQAKAAAPELVGQVGQVGEHEIGYSLFMYDQGQKVQVGAGVETLVAKSALGSVVLGPNADVSKVNRLVQDLNFKLLQDSGTPNCSMTMIEQRAKNDAQSRMLGTVSQQCFFEWLELPDGLAQDTMYDTPQVRGALADKKAHGLKWRVSMYTRAGEQVVLAEQAYSIEAVDPQAPEVSLASKYQLQGQDVVVVPMSESSYGVATITAVRSQLDIAVGKDGQDQATTVKPGSGAAQTRAQRVLEAAPGAAWTASQHKVRAAYSLIPSVFTEKTMTVYLAPPVSIKPTVTVQSTTGIDSQAYPVEVAMFDRTRANEAYDEATMGRWKVRLVREMAQNKREPLTEFVDAEGGKAHFDVDLAKVDGTSMRFNVEAQLQSPVAGYGRTETAARSTLVTIVRGGLIEGTITGTRLSGQAPFKSLLKLNLRDTKNARYTGAVAWEISADGGASWQAIDVDERYKYQLSRVYELGQYQVRAKITNAHSGVSGYTPAVDLVAYDKPKVQMVGSRSHFVGTKAQLKAVLKSGDREVDAEGYTIEWSSDGGKTFDHSGAALELQYDQPTHLTMALRAKPRNAPETDFSAYHMVRFSLDFLPIKAPLPHISAPPRMEKGKSYTITARITMPYHGMGGVLRGVFTLPNGQQVEGDSATYTPTDQDMEKEFVETKYTAWVEGFREAGAESTKAARSRTWEYIFPNFGLEIRRTAAVAPATITAILRPIAFTGRLEEPVYEWTLPDGAVVLEEKPTSRVFTLSKDGIGVITVNVADARGNARALEQSVVLGEATPYRVDLQHSASNAFYREPLDVLLRPNVSGGHPLDRVATGTYVVNGQEIEATSTSARVTLAAGDYDIRYRINSRMGAEAEGRVDLNVKTNQLPLCTATERATISSRVYNVDCKDADGRMKAYEWTVNGQVAGATGTRLSINLKSGESPPSVTVVGIDDAGGRSAPVQPQPSAAMASQ